MKGTAMFSYRLFVASSLSSILIAGCASHSAMQSPNSSTPSGGAQPKIVQTGAYNGWVFFPVAGLVTALAQGPDTAEWMTLDTIQRAGVVGRMDMAGHLTTYNLRGTAMEDEGFDFTNNLHNYLTRNPDGNMYFAEQGGIAKYAIAQVTPQGRVTDYKLPGSAPIETIVSGSDGDIWMSRGFPAKISPNGQYTGFPQRINFRLLCLTNGPDRNLWGLAQYVGYGHGPALARVSIVDGSITLYSSQVDCPLSAYGWLWFVNHTASGNVLVRCDTNVVCTTLGPISYHRFHSSPLLAGSNHTLYWAGGDSVNDHSLRDYNTVTGQSRILSPIGRNNIFSGPDGQLWNFDISFGVSGIHVYLDHPIIPSPASITVPAGSSTPLALKEKGAPKEQFTCVSNNPSVATVTGSGASFTVTGVSPGSTTITASDKIGNSLDVPVTVQ